MYHFNKLVSVRPVMPAVVATEGDLVHSGAGPGDAHGHGHRLTPRTSVSYLIGKHTKNSGRV